MKKYLKMIPYLIVNIAAFYLLPLIIQNTGTGMIVMLIGIPAICFVTSIIFGIKSSFQWIYPLAVSLLFAPTIFIFYNASAAIYILAYGAIAFVGNLIGKMFHKQNNVHLR